MEIHELQQLLSEMSLQEKIGQMVQLTGMRKQDIVKGHPAR